MKNICIFTEKFLPYIGGGQIHVYETSKLLIKKGWNVHIITSKHEINLKSYEMLDNISIHRVNAFFKYGVLNSVIYIIKSVFLYHKLKNNIKFDIIHSHVYFGALAAVISNLNGKYPHIVTSHGIYSDVWKRGDKKEKLKIFFEKLIMKLNYDVIICVSKYIKKQLIYNFNLKKNIIVIYNGVNFKQFNLDKIHPNKKNNFIITYMGRLDEIKGVEYLIYSIPIILKHQNKIELNIYGEGDQLSKLKSLVYKLKINNYVNFMNFIPHENVPNILRSTDVVVLPSVMEGLPLLILESMSMKVPVIATSVGGVPEIIKNNINGILIEPKNPDQIANAINILMSDKKLRNNIINNAYKNIVKNYSWENVIYKTIDVYDNLLGLKN